MNLSPSPSSRTSRRWRAPPPRPRSPAATPSSSSRRPPVTTCGPTSPRRHGRHRPLGPRPGRQRAGPPGPTCGLRRPPGRQLACWSPPGSTTIHDGRPYSASSTHLADAGARRIGLLTGTTDRHVHPSVDHRLPALVRARRPGPGLRRRISAHDPCARRGRRLTGCSPVRTGPTPSTACSTRTAPILLAAARRYGLRVPEDLLLVCCSESTVYATIVIRQRSPQRNNFVERTQSLTASACAPAAFFIRDQMEGRLETVTLAKAVRGSTGDSSQRRRIFSLDSNQPSQGKGNGISTFQTGEDLLQTRTKGYCAKKKRPRVVQPAGGCQNSLFVS